LGPMVPAPCGAARGLGMIHDRYYRCQSKCFPGIAEEKVKDNLPESSSLHIQANGTLYHQEEVLIRVPLAYQMTRTSALDTILPLLPGDVQRATNLNALDDAALLVLQLAHERGVGRYSKWLPYIATLPSQPSCGYNRKLRRQMLDLINALHVEFRLEGILEWDKELVKAAQYADKIAESLAKEYGEYISKPDNIPAEDNIKWALCQVASRATAGSGKHGSLRLVPVIDMINHDANAGGFVELDGTERISNGHFVDAREQDSGTFVVRSLRYGRRNPLKRGQELLATYNVPHYTALDWLISVGYIPPERWHNWQKVDPVLPRVRHDGLFGENIVPTEEDAENRLPELLQRFKDAEL
jgi:hypothetical protein